MPEFNGPQQSPSESITVTNHNTNDRQQQWMRTGSNLGSILAGGALAVYGVSRRNASGTALAAAGGFLALRGIRRATAKSTVHVERSFTINRPVSEVFSYFRNFENLPKFMSHLKEVRIADERISHWVALAPMGMELEWDAEIVDEEQNRRLVWQSLPGTLIPNRGSVNFRAASEYHGGTEIMVAMDYAPPAGKGGALFARVFGREPGMQIREDLRRLKQLLETGEIATTQGQAHGRRTAFVRMMQAVNESPKDIAKAQKESEERPWAVVS